MGRVARDRPGRSVDARRARDAARPGRRPDDRSDRGDVPAYLADEPRQGPADGGAGVPGRGPGGRGAAGPHGACPARARSPGTGGADPDRRRRHAVVRAPPGRRGRAGRGHPEDDGQRRPRHRLLHRVLHRDHAHRDLHPPAAHERRLARALGDRRGVRALQRRDVARLGVPVRGRSGDHLRSAVRHREARGAADGRQAREPQPLRDDDDLGGRHDGRRRDGAGGSRGRVSGTASSAASASSRASCCTRSRATGSSTSRSAT